MIVISLSPQLNMEVSQMFPFMLRSAYSDDLLLHEALILEVSILILIRTLVFYSGNPVLQTSE